MGVKQEETEAQESQQLTPDDAANRIVSSPALACRLLLSCSENQECQVPPDINDKTPASLTPSLYPRRGFQAKLRHSIKG